MIYTKADVDVLRGTAHNSPTYAMWKQSNLVTSRLTRQRRTVYHVEIQSHLKLPG
jgi:hypothetical protein